MNESYELYEFATKVNTMVIFYLIIGLCIMFISGVLGYILKEGKAFMKNRKQKKLDKEQSEDSIDK